MIEFNTIPQPIRRTPRLAACGLAAVAIVVAGLGVCVPTEPTDSALTADSTSVEGAPQDASNRGDQIAFRDQSRAIQLPVGSRTWTRYETKRRTDIGCRSVDPEILRRANELRHSLMTKKHQPASPATDYDFFGNPPNRCLPADSYPRQGGMFGPSAPGTFDGDLDKLRK